MIGYTHRSLFHDLYSTNNNFSSNDVSREISGFAYPLETLTSTATGQWYVNDIAVVGQTGTTFQVGLFDIGLPIRQGNSNVLTVWHPNQISAVARFWMAARNALTSISPDTLATDGQTVRRWNGIISGTQSDQSVGINQPIYRATGQGGNPSIEFDGSNDFFALPPNSDVFQGKSQGYLIAGVREQSPTSGVTTKTIAIYSRGDVSASARLSLIARIGGANNFAAGARRNDADAFTSAQSANNSNYNVLGAHGDWSNGFVRLRVNGSVATSTALAGGSGSTSNTSSVNAFIGANNNGGEASNAHITAVCAINASISATDLSRIERYIDLLGGGPNNIALV
jgi:hypothetical protein